MVANALTSSAREWDRYILLSPVHTSNNVQAKLSIATSWTILSTKLNVASTKSNVASILLPFGNNV